MPLPARKHLPTRAARLVAIQKEHQALVPCPGSAALASVFPVRQCRVALLVLVLFCRPPATDTHVQEWGDVLKFFDYLLEKCDKIIITKGNHDNILEPLVRKREKVELTDFYVVGEFAF